MSLSGQSIEKGEESTFRMFDIFPAISYAPETKLTLGVIGNYYLHLARKNEPTYLSTINFLAVLTTAKQTAVEGTWDIFTSGNQWRCMGQLFYNRYPSRNYGLGNQANNYIREFGEEGSTELLNYLRFQSDIIRFAPVFLKQVKKGIYMGLHSELEHIYRLKITPNRFQYVGDSTVFTDLPVKGTFSGIGLQFTMDSRDYVLNPLAGHYIRFSNLYYVRWMGSSYVFHKYALDARRYLNPVSNHTIAFRLVLNYRDGKDPIPLRGLSRVGGRDFIRGYFKGTFQDHHLAGFEAEYRFPFWQDFIDAPWWQIWKRMGLVCFLGGAQVFGKENAFQINEFNWAAGAGIRILLNQTSRVNLRIDYANGLNKNGDGPGKRQSGLYFFLAEAF
jgi:outer membrane protein assembly factor BamA